MSNSDENIINLREISAKYKTKHHFVEAYEKLRILNRIHCSGVS